MTRIAAALLVVLTAMAWSAGPGLSHGVSTHAGHSHHAPDQTERRDALVMLCRSGGLLAMESVSETQTNASFRTFGRVIPDPTRVLNVNAYLSGQVTQVLVRPQTAVRKGDVVAKLSSPDFLLTQKAYLALLNNEEQQAILKEEGRLPAYLSDARDNLVWWGMSAEEIDALTKNGKVVESISVRAPSDGIITDVLVQPGQLVNAGDKTMQNFVVVGKALLRMIPSSAPPWIEAYIPADRAAAVRAGSPMLVEMPSGSPVVLDIAEVRPDVEPTNLMARAVARLTGEAAVAFAPGQMVQTRIEVQRPPGVWVPREAVAGQGIEPIVFIEIKPGIFQRRHIEMAEAAGDYIRVSGVKPGERVVTSGKMVLEGAYRLQEKEPEASASCGA
ncbi:MAG: efflux RND transporter periplasmic adaptor subunit [Rhizobiales bacterium]|nr:efflux RND transporter periplasmic adaptor subunit [Hyphomicrobiales bacterium]